MDASFDAGLLEIVQVFFVGGFVVAATNEIVGSFDGNNFVPDHLDAFLAVEGGGARSALMLVEVINQGGEVALEVFDLFGDEAETFFGDGLESRGVIGDVSRDFAAVFLGDEAEFFELFGGRIDGSAVLIDASGNFGRGALTVLDKIEIDFSLDLGEANLHKKRCVHKGSLT